MKNLTKIFLVMVIGVTITLGSGLFEEARAQSKVIKIGDIKIEGRIQKPQAFYVLSRAPLNYKNLDLKESFIKKVIQAVKKAPF